MFTLRGLLAPFRRTPLGPYETALRALARGDYSEALERLDALLSAGQLGTERHTEALNKRGVALIGLQRHAEAAHAFEDALRLKPRYVPALVNIGNIHLEAGEIEIAVSKYEAAIASDDSYSPAHHNLAVAYKRLGRTADSVRELRRAHKLLH